MGLQICGGSFGLSGRDEGWPVTTVPGAAGFLLARHGKRLTVNRLRPGGECLAAQPALAAVEAVVVEDGVDARVGDRREVLVGGGEPGAPARPDSEAKIAAIGVHISRGVTSHGFALNVNTDLSYFDLIVPCGITSKPVTSMQKELDRKIDFNAVAETVSRNFGTVFVSQMLWVETIDGLLGHSVGVPVKPPAELRNLSGEDEMFLA